MWTLTISKNLVVRVTFKKYESNQILVIRQRSDYVKNRSPIGTSAFPANTDSQIKMEIPLVLEGRYKIQGSIIYVYT